MLRSKSKTDIRRILSVLLILMMIFTSIPLTVFADVDSSTNEVEEVSSEVSEKITEDATEGTVEDVAEPEVQAVVPYASESKATSEFKGKTSKDLQEVINKAQDGDIISVNNEVKVDSTVEINKSITLNGSGKLIRKGNFTGIMLKVTEGINATIDGEITIDGKTSNDQYGDSAVYISTGATLTMNGGEICNNLVELDGAGVYNAGIFKLNDGKINGNKTKTGQSARGGGIYNAEGATSEITGGTISGNYADYGGGIYNRGTLTMSGGNITGENRAKSGAGVNNTNKGTFEMSGGTIYGNVTDSQGGGVYNQGAFKIKGDAKVENNTKGQDQDNIFVYISGSYSAPIEVSGEFSGFIGVNTTVYNSEVIYTSVENYEFVDHYGCFKEDKVDAYLSINKDGDKIYYNKAHLVADGDTEGFIDAINSANDEDIIKCSGDLYISDPIDIEKNITIVGNGSLKLIRAAGNTAQILCIRNNANVTLDNVQIDGNKGAFSENTGAAVYTYNVDVSLYMRKSYIFNNRARDGGGIYNIGKLTLRDCEITQNDASQQGGGIYNSSTGSISMINGSISENTAGREGGGIYNSGSGSISMINGKISENTAGVKGAGVYYTGSGFEIEGSATVYGNTSNGESSDTYLESGMSITLNGVYTGKMGLEKSEYGNAIVAKEGYTITEDDEFNFIATVADVYIELKPNENVIYYGPPLNNNDLQQRIDAAAGGTVKIKGTVKMYDEVKVNNSVTIVGNGNAILSRQGDNDSRLMTINAENVTIESVVFDGNNKKTSLEAVLINSGKSLTMNSCTVRNNISRYDGGGIKNYGTLTLNETNVDNNEVYKVNGIGQKEGSVGGGIYNSGTLTINSGSLSRNTVTYHGGGIYNEGIMTVNNGTIKGNKVTGDFHVIPTRSYTAGGGGIYSSNGEVTMTGGTVEGNTANKCSSSYPCYGGGVYAKNFTLTGGTISNNTSQDGYGGGVSGANIKINGGTIQGNTAEYGGGIYAHNLEMTNGEILQNNAEKYGGGVYIHSSSKLAMSGGKISENTASVDGGGVYNAGTFEVRDATTVIDNGVNKDNNVRMKDSDHPIIVTGKCIGKIKVSAPGFNQVAVKAIPEYTISQTDVPCFEADGVAYLDLTNNTLVYREVTLVNGGTSDDLQNAVNETKNGIIWVSGTIEMRSEVLINDKSVAIIGKDNAKLSRAQDSTYSMLHFHNNSNSSIENLIIDGNKDNIIDSIEPPIYIDSGAKLTMKSGTIQNNTTKRYGGGVYVDFGTFEMIDGTITKNTVSGDGGSIYSNNGTVIINGGTISANTASSDGGGIYAQNGTLTINGGTITENTASSDGGGIYTNSVTLTINGGTITENTSSGDGGGVCSYSTITMNGGTISGNTSSEYGGGIYNYGGGNSEIKDGIINGNTAEYGGGIYSKDANLTISNGEISNNIAKVSGGGIYHQKGLHYGTLKISDGIINKNSAKANGGGIYNYEGIIKISGGTISENKAGTTNSYSDAYGGGIRNNEGTVTIDGGTINGNTARFGGGIFNGDSGTLTISGGIISENDGSRYGGGICNEEATVTINGGIISENSADYGGGIHTKYGTVTINDGTITKNNSVCGGGISNDAGTLKIKGGTITEHTESRFGGGIYNGGTLTMTGGTVSNNENCGVYVCDGSPFNVQGSAKVIDNGVNKHDNVVFESENDYITITGEFTGFIKVKQNSFNRVVVKPIEGYDITQSDLSCFEADDDNAHLSLIDNEIIYMENKTEWGQITQINGVTYYIDENGKASAEVTGNHQIWLNTKLDGSGNWYCIDNSQGIFKIGSRFYIKTISNLGEYYDKIESKYREEIADGKLRIFLIGVIDPDGNEYTDLEIPLICYIKVDSDWNSSRIKAVFINKGNTERVNAEYIGETDGPSKNEKFVKLTVNHFSPYAIYESKVGNTTSASTSNSTNIYANTTQTGDITNYIYIVGIAVLAAVSLASVILIKKKKRNK